MPGYSPDVLEDLRQGNDIVDVVSQYVQLRQTGANHVGLCPFHREKSPSFSVSSHKQLFHCFGCGAGGNVFSFITKIENFGFMDAIKFLADRINYVLPQLDGRQSASVAEKNQIYDIYKLAARFYYDALQEPQARHAVDYLNQRQMHHAVRRKFGLGYSAGKSVLRDYLKTQGYDDAVLLKAGLVLESKDGKGFFDRFRGRLMFPIFDVAGKVIGFGGRILGEGQPKYLNSPETPVFDKSSTLYGLNYARLAKTHSIILVEGYMDVIALYQYGFKNAVAALGTAFTASHARILKRYCKEVVILFDSDDAGIRAALRAIPHLYSVGLAVRVAVLPDAKDPDEYLIRYGSENFAAQMAKAMDFVEFQIENARHKYDLGITSQRVAFLKEAAEIIGKLGSAIEQEAYLRDLSTKYQMDQGAVKQEIDKKKNDEPLLISNFTNNPPAAPAKSHPDAIAHILYSMATNQVLYEKILHHLKAEEFGEPLYINIFNIILKNRKAGREIIVADIISELEEKEQQQAAAIFARVTEYEDSQMQYNALGQQITRVKEVHFERSINNAAAAGQFELMDELAKAKNRLNVNKIVL